MRPVDLDRQTGGVVTIDVCDRCKALWFDAFESVQLSPGRHAATVSRHP
jgi:hypothetical protein